MSQPELIYQTRDLDHETDNAIENKSKQIMNFNFQKTHC
jgi:hypothetical protein